MELLLGFANFLKEWAPVATAVGVCIAAMKLSIDDKHKRTDRAVDLLEKFHAEEESDHEGAAMLNEFGPKYERLLGIALTEEEANKFWAVSSKRGKHYTGDDEERRNIKRYSIARRHLNRLSPIAFAYVHRTANRDLLLRSAGAQLVRSEFYFRELIRVFGERQGKYQSWQIITEAAKKFKHKDPALCNFESE